MTVLTLAAVEAALKGMPPEKLAEVAQQAKPILDRAWLPQEGPQTEAYYSPADELLYGGAAGGGKTDLLCGLATTAHQRSLLFRRQSTDLDGLWDRLNEIIGDRVTQSNANKRTMRLRDGRSIEGGHLEKPGAEKSWQGRPHDFIGVDEGAQIDEFKIAFVIQWLRSTDPKQRIRLVIGTNPPIPEWKNGQIIDTGTGAWLKEWFAPWIDDTFPNPARDGELRWCYMIAEGDRLKTIWVEGPGRYNLLTGERVADDVATDTDSHAFAKSRSFIRSKASDNKYLGPDYTARLSATPEPLRSLLMNGDFSVKVEDHPMQVIPTAWVMEAQQRWHERRDEKLTQLVLAADIAQGGADTTVLASLLDTNFFEELVTQPGRDTPTGIEVTQLLLRHRRNGALIVLDGGGGWGGSTRDLLRTHHRIRAAMCVSSTPSKGWTADMMYKYGNVRSEIWLGFRDALNPDSGEGICLPPSHRLLAQLTAPIQYYRGNTVWIESKDELRIRLQSSTDDADAVLMAWHYRKQALALRLHQSETDPMGGLKDGARARAGQVPMADPLGNW